MRQARWMMVAFVVGCGAPAPAPGTGGGVLPEGQCGRGLVAVQSDYQSTNVSLLGRDGEVVSSSFISSGSADPGLSAALSGDVTPPTPTMTGDDVVLIDRYPASLVSWVDVESAEVRAQLDVRTGFTSNPQDYLRHSETKAYLSRYESNPSPGQEPFDEGGDLLIVDPSVPAITGRIDLHEAVADADGALPRPSRMVQVDDGVVVLLEAISQDFTTFGASRVALVDPMADAVTDVVALDGLAGCWGAAAEPPIDDAGAVSARRVAVTCNGGFTAEGTADVARAGVAVLSVEQGQIAEIARFAAAEVTGRSMGAGIAFADDSRLLVVGMGDEVVGQPDVLVALGLDGATETLLTTDERAFSIGEIRCMGRLHAAGDAGGCGACWVADAERGVLHRFDGSLSHAGEVTVDSAIGLPPRHLGRL